METINNFRGDYRFLSNFYLADVEFEGIRYPSTEHAYQAAKTLNKEERAKFASPDVSSAQAKKMGADLKRRGLQRLDWEQHSLNVMYILVSGKFLAHKKLRDRLLATGDIPLEEGNGWHDNFFGNCYCEKCKDIEGRNFLGKILMRVRTELRNVR